MSRDDPESHEAALTGRRNRRLDRFAERRDVREHVVRGKHEQQRVTLRSAGSGRECRDGDRGRRIPADGLENDRARLDADLPQLLGDEEAVRLVADDDRIRDFRQPDRPERGVLDHRALADERQELLGVQLA